MRKGECYSYEDESANTCLNDKNEVSDNKESDVTPSLGIIPFGNKLRVDEKDIKGIQGGFLLKHQRCANLFPLVHHDY